MKFLNIICFFLLLSLKSFSNITSVSIKIDSKLLNGGKVVLSVYNFYLDPIEDYLESKYELDVKNDSIYIFKPETNNKYFYLNVYYINEEQRIYRSWNGLDLVLVKSDGQNLFSIGNHIEIPYKNDLFHYQYKLKNVNYNMISSNVKNRQTFWNDFENLLSYLNDLDNVQFPDNISEDVDIYKQILLNFKCKVLRSRLRLMRAQGGLSKNNESNNYLITEAMIRLQGYALNYINGENNSEITYNFPALIYELELLKYRFNNPGKSDVDFYFLFSEEVLNKYNGKLRDQLISFILFNSAFYEIDPYFDYLNKLLPSIENRDYSQIYLKFSNSLNKDSPVYPFQLKDVWGNSYNLENFKGKILIIEFWFNGCFPCQLLSKSLNMFLDNFDENEKIQLVTINVDLKKSEFIKGLQSGLYTSNRSINLHIGDLGYFDPMLKHYAFKGYPQLIIIDKDSKLITARAPKPLNEKLIKDLDILIKNELKY